MKRILTAFILVIFNLSLSAQTDTSAYNSQRIKINKLLENRSMKFSQYDNSLTKRTGIFGLKTKRDMQVSNDILTKIVLTDNEIFSELKILLDYKDFEKKEVEHRAVTVEGRIERFQSTITKLQQENDKLKDENIKHSASFDKMKFYLTTSLIALALAIIYAIRGKKLRKADIKRI
ncbi:hypothetical protein [Daejeonella lutea]|uniref:Four helix bundle sensory module for signal transduction n=1 Tax=Daejeonella lutea TaxID=572036 RepID=A0A1T5AHU8_9SPHI|nr:hypothetical protein [Daejeonella lutea]SKB34572.1 hypothetical protein SAMN05661099_0746 [Daejeonella lutea]